ncbi:rhodanese-like domain-containing protein [Anaerolentibacter hominis]|uniref:rhodanese-like domain-containing protein n=1 Tax=Anaerolentibacter hominis TaxID=3079009 RepID=UPI0031B884AB
MDTKIKKMIVSVTCLLLSVVVLAGCSKKQSSPEDSAYHSIDAKKAKEMMDADSSVVVVDVRTPEEFAEKHIEGAINIPLQTIEDTQPELLPDLDATILIHCRTGIRSRQASDKLVEIGYQNIYDFGGIADWPYETVGTTAGN